MKGVFFMDLLEGPLLKVLLDGTIPFYEVMNLFGIRVTIANLPPAILGFTYQSRKGRYHLLLNGNISYQTQCKTFIHEVKHILNEMPKLSYVIGLDMSRTTFEIEADHVAEYFMQNYMKKIS